MNKLEEAVSFGSYSSKDVIFLLKDLSGHELEGAAEEREINIQSGQHYSETLPIEYQPPAHYLQLFWDTLHDYKEKVAECTAIVAEQIWNEKGPDAVLVSLARAGTPIGILIKRYIFMKYKIDLPHYSISIIRDRGLDANAVKYILNAHPNKKIQFIDGWTGKGAISIELTKACRSLHETLGIELDDTLAVLADPGYCTSLFGTREDFLIPSACLNSTVSGLISRTVLNASYIGEEDFHGAKFYQELTDADVSNIYLEEITSQFDKYIENASEKVAELAKTAEKPSFKGMDEVKRIQSEFEVTSTHFVKPGVGETTRVLLRRIPWKILVRDFESPYIKHIAMLAEERGVELVHYPNMSYTCCGLIKKVGSES